MAQSAKLHQGDVVLIPFPFADLSGQKVRPAVVVSADPQGTELIVAFITSVLTNRSPRGALRW
jgi:mRNA interferase MazF